MDEEDNSGNTERGEAIRQQALKGKGDAIVYAVDASGNVSATASCLVPPLPK